MVDALIVSVFGNVLLPNGAKPNGVRHFPISALPSISSQVHAKLIPRTDSPRLPETPLRSQIGTCVRTGGYVGATSLSIRKLERMQRFPIAH